MASNNKPQTKNSSHEVIFSYFHPLSLSPSLSLSFPPSHLPLSINIWRAPISSCSVFNVDRLNTGESEEDTVRAPSPGQTFQSIPSLSVRPVCRDAAAYLFAELSACTYCNCSCQQNNAPEDQSVIFTKHTPYHCHLCDQTTNTHQTDKS